MTGTFPRLPLTFNVVMVAVGEEAGRGRKRGGGVSDGTSVEVIRGCSVRGLHSAGVTTTFIPHAKCA